MQQLPDGRIWGQMALEQEGTSLVDVLYEEMGERIGLLMTNQFGNYLFQKILEMSSDQQRRQLVGLAGC